jgi:hypothetical protein
MDKGTGSINVAGVTLNVQAVGFFTHKYSITYPV